MRPESAACLGNWNVAKVTTSLAHGRAQAFVLRGHSQRSIVRGWFQSFRCERNISSDPKKATVQKLVLMSVIFASIIIPARAARMKNAQLGLKKTLVQVALYNAFYVFLLMYVVGRL